ncbi:MAG: sulfite exporter TauE/SafE family protein, partial [Actinobacteria bacterium]|nr:sulfite exporter TauE/SafE family protein [Actinomycetota bacterium]
MRYSNVSRKRKMAVLAFFLIVIAGIMPVCCCGHSLAAAENENCGITMPLGDIEKVELLYFHPRFRCVSCNDVERYAREVVETEFEKEVEGGKLKFKSLAIYDKDNAKLVKELGVTGSSLFVVVSDGDKTEFEEIKSVWLHSDDSARCKQEISDELAKYVRGEDSKSNSQPFENAPAILAAFLLGLLTAISPCPLATNIAALSFVLKKLDNKKYTVIAGVLYTTGRMLAYTVIGILLVLIGMSASSVSLFMQNYADKILGPLLIFFGLIMLDIIKFSIFKGRMTSAIQAKIGDWGLFSSFLLGMLFALAFCPYSAILFFGMLIPIALESTGGIALPAVYGFGTGLPVMVFAIALSLGVSEMGKHIARIQKFEKYFRWLAGVIFVGVGIYYLVILAGSLF